MPFHAVVEFAVQGFNAPFGGDQLALNVIIVIAEISLHFDVGLIIVDSLLDFILEPSDRVAADVVQIFAVLVLHLHRQREVKGFGGVIFRKCLPIILHILSPPLSPSPAAGY